MAAARWEELGLGFLGRGQVMLIRERAPWLGWLAVRKVGDAVAFAARNGREETASNEKVSSVYCFRVACWAGLAGGLLWWS